MTADLIVIVPTRSRPQNVRPVIEAWRDTNAFADGGRLHFVFDADDPHSDDYWLTLVGALTGPVDLSWEMAETWRPLVPKLNREAVKLASQAFALGFAGDDHRPRTHGWVRAYVDALRAGAGIVHGDDGYQHENLPTEWAMVSGIVAALGEMVPAPVEHLYCDNAVRDLGQATGLLRYLPDVHIEHMHPAAGKTDTDEQYDRVNGREQYRRDRRAYRDWRDNGGLHSVIELLRKGETHP